MGKEYFIGLDVGTDSVGWATADTDFNLLRLKGKTAWGARIFDEAQDAKTRRSFRASKRRINRRKYRIKLLNSLFEEEIFKIDKNFFFKMEESSYKLNDKSIQEFKGSLLGEKEKEYYKHFPTIWHLRSALMHNDEYAFSDIRFLYMAIHHIIKYRGNFLKSGEININEFDCSVFDDITDFLKQVIAEKEETDIENVEYTFINRDNFDNFLKCLLSSENKTAKKKILKSYINSYSDIDKTYIDFVITLLVGGSFDASKLGDFEKQSISFGNDYDEKEATYESVLGDKFEIVKLCKVIFDYCELHDILGESSSLSQAFSDIYNSHQMQLKALKRIVIKIDKYNNVSKEEERLYYKIFKDSKSKNNYSCFVHSNSEEKRAGIHDFNANIKNLLSGYTDLFKNDKEYNCILQLCENDKFLQTIALSSTSVIPHQLHLDELKKILSNAKKHYSFINSELEDKIIKLFLHRIPYYYGPLNDKSAHSNVVRNSNDIITPWNIENVINQKETRNKFMSNLTNSCSYLYGEDVLPKDSIVYEDYINLDRLNKITINGNKIDQTTKIDLFNNVISLRAKTTINQLKTYLEKKYAVYEKDGVVISGINDTDSFISNSRFIMSKVFNLETEMEKAERIIKLLAIYTDNYQDAINVIKEEFSLNNEQIKIIKQLKCKGWGSLSYKLLNGIRYIDDSRVASSIYDLLLSTTDNFQQIINSNIYKFNEKIDNINKEFFGEKTSKQIADEMIEDLPPKMRRSTIQAVKIVNEIKKITKEDPKAIAIEVTRENKEENKHETRSRYFEIKDFISKLLGETGNDSMKSQAEKVLNELEDIKEKDQLSRLKGTHLYLYFKQNGIDVYTGEPININDVIDSTKYDRDHIIPQSKIKDDSLENLVLVDRVYNQRIKSDKYPLPKEIRYNHKVIATWKYLHAKGLMGDKKYNNLIRATELTDDELNDFVNAQINVVNHSNMAIRNVLSVLYPNTKLIFSKAQYPSYIRREYEIPKNRDINDTHHAVDAYLNIISGVVLTNKYSDIRLIKTNKNTAEVSSYNMERTLKYYIDNNIKETLIKNCQRHDMLLTYRVNYSDSSFYDQTIYPGEKGKALIPIHTKNEKYLNSENYGGYSSLSVEYLFVITIKTKKGIQKILSQVSHLDSMSYSINELKEKISKEIPLKSGEEILNIDLDNKLYPKQKVIINKVSYLLLNKNEKQLSLKPISPIFMDNKDILYLNFMEKNNNVIQSLSTNINEYDFTTDKENNNHIIISKENNARIIRYLIDLSQQSKYEYCNMIHDIKDYYDYDTFTKLSMYEQYNQIIAIIKLFTRNSLTSTITKNAFLKSKNSILKDNVEVIYDSVTGLFTSKREL